MAPTTEEARLAVAGNPLWYHTLEVAPGVVTPGWFDVRPALARIPFPDVRGKRCLDIGTYDGFFAFELERRGAAEVVATDISDHAHWDWPPDMRAAGPDRLAAIAGPEKGLGFRIAKELLASEVQRVECSIYDLSPDRVGTFDVVVCGSLLLHLRDPLRALEAVRSVCDGVFLSAEEIRLGLSLLTRGRPVAELNGSGELGQWWVPTAAGHEQMVFAAGFEVVQRTRPYCIALGPAHPRPKLRPRIVARTALTRVACGMSGVPQSAVLARPRV
ncbi:MAG: tRNA (mo5U34)-methyltransferase [Solirubrobacteraceae bacterium]|jgi:tRNA (mo5U34)-methyltransferase|nr:tRNA (mo5U34)-methyltransferase [Solirubrobacteraceae bacterium]